LGPFLPRCEKRPKTLTKAQVSRASSVICDASAAEIPASELVKWHHSDITMAQRFQSTHNGKAPVHTEPNATRKPRLLDEDHIEALREFADEPSGLGYYPDSKVFGLTIFLGAKSTVWRFRQQSRTKGKRSSVFKTLGYWPAMDVDEARKQALIYSGAVALAPLPRASAKRCRSAPLLKTTSSISRRKPKLKASRRDGGPMRASFLRRTSCRSGTDGRSPRCRRTREP
jgi:hypothetical protein